MMNVNLSKALMVLLLCVSFIGQAMASTAMSYHMISMKVMTKASPNHDMSMMDHSNHIMGNVSDNVESTNHVEENCCSTTCNCYTSGCSTFIAFLKGAEQYSAEITLVAKIYYNSTLAINKPVTSLYRPPIFS